VVRLRSRAGTSLIEVLVAVAVLAGLGMSVFDLISAGFSGSVRAEKNQAAPRVLARVIDNLVARGYAGMSPAVGSSRDFSWSEGGDLVMEGAAAAAAPGSISGSYRVDPAGPGLLRVAVTLRWTDPRSGQPQEAGSLAAFRYLADPALGMTAKAATAP
jgi:type II secretory pathway pseudopilin PulG